MQGRWGGRARATNKFARLPRQTYQTHQTHLTLTDQTHQPYLTHQAHDYSSSADGAKLGGRRCFVACSYAYAILISVGSLHARPMNDSPSGSPRK